MSKDQAFGAVMLLVSVSVVVLYAWILFFTRYDLILLKASALAAVIVIFGILGWIGYTLATSSPPRPMEEIEKELEEEVKKTREEVERSTDFHPSSPQTGSS